MQKQSKSTHPPLWQTCKVRSAHGPFSRDYGKIKWYESFTTAKEKARKEGPSLIPRLSEEHESLGMRLDRALTYIQYRWMIDYGNQYILYFINLHTYRQLIFIHEADNDILPTTLVLRTKYLVALPARWHNLSHTQIFSIVRSHVLKYIGPRFAAVSCVSLQSYKSEICISSIIEWECTHCNVSLCSFSEVGSFNQVVDILDSYELHNKIALLRVRQKCTIGIFNRHACIKQE